MYQKEICIHPCMYIDSLNFELLQTFFRKTFSSPSSPLSLCLCFLLHCCFCQNVLYPFYWIWELLHYTWMYSCSILVFSFFPFHQISGTFLCCQLAKYFMQVQQVSHILNKWCCSFHLGLGCSQPRSNCKSLYPSPALVKQKQKAAK